jgi:hypothetical protein
LCWLADNDPLKIQALEKMPLLDYFLLLDKKLKDLKKASAKNGNRANNNRVHRKGLAVSIIRK